MDTRDLTITLDDVLEALMAEDGVHQALIVGQG